MATAGTALNLKPHECGTGAAGDVPSSSLVILLCFFDHKLSFFLLLRLQRRVLSVAADIEVHEGTDKRFYVLDTARVFPPEKPSPTVWGVIVVVPPTSVKYVLQKRSRRR